MDKDEKMKYIEVFITIIVRWLAEKIGKQMKKRGMSDRSCEYLAEIILIYLSAIVSAVVISFLLSKIV